MTVADGDGKRYSLDVNADSSKQSLVRSPLVLNFYTNLRQRVDGILANCSVAVLSRGSPDQRCGERKDSHHGSLSRGDQNQDRHDCGSERDSHQRAYPTGNVKIAVEEPSRTLAVVFQTLLCGRNRLPQPLRRAARSGNLSRHPLQGQAMDFIANPPWSRGTSYS